MGWGVVGGAVIAVEGCGVYDFGFSSFLSMDHFFGSSLMNYHLIQALFVNYRTL